MSNVHCIFVLQKKVVRIIHHAGRLAHTNLLFKQMYSLKFPDLVKYRTAILMYNFYYRKLPTLLQERFKKNQNVHNTRRRNTFIVQYSCTNLKAMCITIYGVKLWNTLPEHIKEPKSLFIVKNYLKTYLISLYNV